jgi:NAD-dependent dihydropyrimidine dehydrogenase PreA subunit
MSVDEETCALCEVCARRCPTGALRAERVDGTLRLVFDSRLCDGCPGRQACEVRCTEKALSRTPAESRAPDPEPVVLVCDALVSCPRCGQAFATPRKLRAVSRRKRPGRSLERVRCPVCDRLQLVARFVGERRPADASPTVRTAREILKRAGHWPEGKPRTREPAEIPGASDARGSERGARAHGREED